MLFIQQEKLGWTSGRPWLAKEFTNHMFANKKNKNKKSLLQFYCTLIHPALFKIKFVHTQHTFETNTNLFCYYSGFCILSFLVGMKK